MVEFEIIAEDIIRKEKFQSLRDEPHHGLTRYDHVLRVAKKTHKVSKAMRMDYVSATRGALLHDYFNNADYCDTNGLKKNSLHPVIALNNARREYNLNDTEENIIISHMYPFGNVKPNCKESWLVNSIDTVVAMYECLMYKWRKHFMF